MKINRHPNVLVCLAAAMLAAGPVLAATEAQEASVALTPQMLRTRVFTPSAANAALGAQSRRFSLRAMANSGSIPLAGSTVAVRLAHRGSSYYLGVDADGDGSVGSSEFRRVATKAGRAKSFGTKVKVGEKELAIILVHLEVSGSRTKAFANGAFIPGACMQGSLAGQTIRLVDDNFDGQFTQDGKDAILVGRSNAGVPLRRKHLVGRQHYELEVTQDGTSVKLTPLPADTELGLVKLPMRSGMVKTLVLASEAAAYDVMALPGGVGIPAGNYKLAFGVIGDLKSSLLMVPGKQALTYPIEAGMQNTPRIGKPMKVNFQFRRAGETVSVYPYPMEIVGAGGEIYSPILFDSGGNAHLPDVLVTSGTGNTISKGSMRYG